MPMSITPSIVDAHSFSALQTSHDRNFSMPGSESKLTPADPAVNLGEASLSQPKQIAQASTDAQKSARNSLRDLVNKEGLQIYHGYEDTVIKPIYVLDRTTKSGVVIGGPGEFNVFSTGGTPFDPSAGVNADYKIKVDRSGNITITKSKDESDMQDSTVKVKGSLDFSLGTDGKIKVSVKDENGKLAPIEQFFAPPNISQPTRP